MDEIPYPFEEGPVEYTYRFESVSEQTIIQKVVILTQIDQTNVFNLALVDEGPNKELSDTVVSNNNDMVMVLATVFRIVEDFLNRFPAISVYFSGSDTRRTRLYRVAISRDINRLKQYYTILGRQGNNVIPFVENQEYDGFLIAKKYEID